MQPDVLIVVFAFSGFGCSLALDFEDGLPCRSSSDCVEYECVGGKCRKPGNDQPATCTPQSTWECIDGNIMWFDSCGKLEGVKETCTSGCSGTACTASGCTSHASIACYGGDLVWVNSCGAAEEIYQSCEGRGCTGNTCDSEGCASDPMSSRCYDGDLYWFDGCGNRLGLNRSCNGNPCEGARCVPPCETLSSCCGKISSSSERSECDFVVSLDAPIDCRDWPCSASTMTKGECSSEVCTLCGEGC
jgi:hypothetical protein